MASPQTKLEVTLCSARHLPHVDGMWGYCDAFIELEYKNQKCKSVVVKNTLSPDWKPEEKFLFDLSKGEIDDLKITLKDWNRLTAIKMLGMASISAEKLKQLMAGEKASRLGNEFYLTAPDGSPLVGKDEEQTFILLKIAASESGALAAESAPEVALTNDVGSTNLFNTPVKIGDAQEPRKDLGQNAMLVQESNNLFGDISSGGLKMEFMCDVDGPPPRSDGLTLQQTPILSNISDLVEEPYQRGFLERIKIQDRGDELWSTESPISYPISTFVHSPRSLYATDTSRTEMDMRRNIAGIGYVAGHRPRITLEDRGISTTAGNLYVKENRSLYASAPVQHVRPDPGQDATYFTSSPYSTFTNTTPRTTTAPRTREFSVNNRRLQDYTYVGGERLERSPSIYSASAHYSSNPAPSLYSSYTSSPSTVRRGGWTEYAATESSYVYSPRSQSRSDFVNAPTSVSSSFGTSAYYLNAAKSEGYSPLSSQASIVLAPKFATYGPYSANTSTNSGSVDTPPAPSWYSDVYSSYQNNSRVHTIREEGLVGTGSYRESHELC